MDFLRKIQRVTVFLAIITQITAKNHPVGAAALSGPCSFCKRKFDFFDKLGPAGFCRAFALFSCQLVADVGHK